MKVNSLSSAASKSYKALAFFSSFLGLLFEGAEIGEEAAAVGKRKNFINWDITRSESDAGYILNRTYLIKAYFLPAAAFPYKELAEGYKEADDVLVEVLDDDVWPLDSCNDCKKKINSFRRKNS